MSSQSFGAPIGALHVAELAQLADVTPATVRYYARVNLLNPERDPGNGYQCFSLPDVHRVDFIRQAQSLGLTIREIKDVLATVDDGKLPCPQVKALVEMRLEEVREQIAELQSTEERMAQAVEAWSRMRRLAPRAGEFCPLIERVEVRDCQQPSASRRQTRRKHRHESCHCSSPDKQIAAGLA